MITFRYLVNEIYACLQGEGPQLGTPSVLVRFQICNLRCSFCDTPYTHTTSSDPILALNKITGQTEIQGQKYKKFSPSELQASIQSFNKKHVIFSGGEPTLQAIHRLFPKVLEFASIEVESNGTQIPHEKFKDFEKKDYLSVTWNISPKGTNANESFDVKALAHWANLCNEPGSSVYFKFVIRKDFCNQDLAEVDSLQTNLSIPSTRILLMPEGTTLESQRDSLWLHDYCIANNYRYSPRLHVILFDNKRGV